MNSMIDTRQFIALANAGAVKKIYVVGTSGGFVVKVDETLIEAKRGHPRVFRKLQTAASFLKDKGIGSFSVDLTNWQPEQKALLS
jgi:hypothetical protein